jgi:hypothetical protein
MAMMATPHYRSLVKGEVVAEGVVTKWDLERWRGNPNKYVLLVDTSSEGNPMFGDIPVLVIRAAHKENARTGGKE